MKKLFVLAFFMATTLLLVGQDYFYKSYEPFNAAIPSPEQFLGYPIGSHHTRQDQMVAYLQALADASDRASLIQYGETFGHRKLVMLQIGTPENISNLSAIQEEHLAQLNPSISKSAENKLPVLINLGYNVHGNEPSGGEAALLTAYTMVASDHPDIKTYRDNTVIFLDPVINPDGRDRHTHWANMFKGTPNVADPIDVEHNEGWPRGRTNHYWFDLNRDWLLAINPESRGKLTWYHQWYPHVVTDFHEMGTNSHYFFEPMKANGSKNPIMPVENYTTLNDMFAEEFRTGLDDIGSLYFTKEVFDGTYPGYGSSYPDLQGGLGILFEQASSRGHVQDRPTGQLTFAFTIRNQFVSSIATVKASVKNKEYLQNYQRDFFSSANTNAKSSAVGGYVFGDAYDHHRNLAFLDKLLLHKIEVYKTKGDDNSYYVPTNQAQYRMVQSMFETYDEYQDSVFYDASAWSVANFYNMPYKEVSSRTSSGDAVTWDDLILNAPPVTKSEYAYMVSWDAYNAPAFLYQLLDQEVRVSVAQKPFTIESGGSTHSMSYGSLIIPVASQEMNSTELHTILVEASERYGIEVITTSTGYASSGIDLGSRYVSPVTKPKALMLTHGSVSSYEAGEVWHLLDQRVGMPITKVASDRFSRIDLENYNTLVLVSGNYRELDSTDIQSLKDWLSKGNTLIASRTATQWAIRQKLVKEELLTKQSPIASDDSTKAQKKIHPLRKLYINAQEDLGQERIGGIILQIDLDITHPVAYGYRESKIPVYRNSTVWLKPSENPYTNIGLYTEDPHIDGFITKKNMDTYLKKSASIIVSPIGRGRAVLFAENPNFRGSWYGTNKLFLNSLFFGDQIRVPD